MPAAEHERSHMRRDDDDTAPASEASVASFPALPPYHVARVRARNARHVGLAVLGAAAATAGTMTPTGKQRALRRPVLSPSAGVFESEAAPVADSLASRPKNPPSRQQRHSQIASDAGRAVCGGSGSEDRGALAATRVAAQTNGSQQTASVTRALVRHLETISIQQRA